MQTLLFLILLAVTASQGQTFRAVAIFSSTDCSGNAVAFSAVNATGGCTPVACAPLVSGSGSQLVTCVTASTPVPPNTIVCPTCSSCGGYSYSGTSTCTITPSNEAVISGVSVNALGKCYPHGSGVYKIFNGCNTAGTPSNETYYTSNTCTTPVSPQPSFVPFVPCIASAFTCSPLSPTTSLQGRCVYYTGPPTNGTNGGSSGPMTYSFAMLCTASLFVWLFL